MDNRLGVHIKAAKSTKTFAPDRTEAFQGLFADSCLGADSAMRLFTSTTSTPKYRRFHVKCAPQFKENRKEAFMRVRTQPCMRRPQPARFVLFLHPLVPTGGHSEGDGPRQPFDLADLAALDLEKLRLQKRDRP